MCPFTQRAGGEAPGAVSGYRGGTQQGGAVMDLDTVDAMGIGYGAGQIKRLVAGQVIAGAGSGVGCYGAVYCHERRLMSIVVVNAAVLLLLPATSYDVAIKLWSPAASVPVAKLQVPSPATVAVPSRVAPSWISTRSMPWASDTVPVKSRVWSLVR